MNTISELIYFLFLLLFSFTLLLYFVSTVICDIKGAPFVPTPKKRIETLKKIINLKGKKFVDLGSGSGRVVIEAAKNGAKAYGVELNPLLVLYSIIKSKILRVKNTHFIIKDISNFNISNFDIIFIYLMPEFIDKIKEKLKNEADPNAIIISEGFKIKGWKHFKEKNKLYFYRTK